MSTSFDPFGAQPLRATLATAALPRRVHRLLEQLFSLASGELARELDQLLMEFEQELFRLAEQARDPTLRAGYMDTLRSLRLHRADLVPHFLVELETALTRIREAPPVPGSVPKTSQVIDDLRLVEDSEIDEDTALRMIAVRHEWRASLPLLLLGQRFGVIAGAPAFDAERLPFGPHVLGRLLAKASQSLHVDLESRLLLYRLFDRQLMKNYVPLVEALNLLLSQQNVLPGLSYVPLRTRPPSRDAPAPPATEVPGRASTEKRAGPESSAYTGWLGDTEATPSDDESAQMFMRLQEMLNERRSLLEKLRAPANSATARSNLSTVELSAALGTLQVQPHASRGLKSIPDIRQTLLAQSRQQTGSGAALSPEDSDTFELLAMLYAAIRREMRDDAPSLTLLERLQLPLLRIALKDRGFFLRARHPARQLLNAVAESGAAWLSPDEIDPQLQQQLQAAVDMVVDHQNGGVTVFEDANRMLQKHLQAMVRRAEVSERRHVEAARGKEKLELAKRRALHTINTLVQAHQPPKFLRTLLCQAWADVLTLVLLRHGEDSPEWRQHEDTTRSIIDTSMHGAVASAGLAERIEDALTLVGYHADEAAAIAQHLTSSGEDPDQGDDDPASRTELAMKLKARARLGTDARDPLDAEAPRSPAEEACFQRLSKLPFGSWIELAGEPGGIVRRRLAWFSPATGRALLVNQRGQRVEEQTLGAMARLMAAGTAKIVTSDSARLVDRAWQATVSGLRNIAEREPTPRNPDER